MRTSRWRATICAMGAALSLFGCQDRCGAPNDCPAGSRRWEDGGACLPIEPCVVETTCAGEGRACVIDGGVATCGRCLDGFLGDGDVEDGGACVPEDDGGYVGPFRVGADWFAAWDGARYRHLFLRGMNVGGARPGEIASQNSLVEADWLRWMAIWAEAGLNVLRVYDLHYAGLYQALVTWNEANPEHPIYLLQGVYLRDDEIELLHDLHDRTPRFDADVVRAIDCIHGACADDPSYPDASPWVMGWLLGREVLSGEVLATDEAHADVNSYPGGALSITNTSPSTVWAVERLDRAVVYERNTYDVERPVGFSNWIELDPIDHPTEPPWGDQDVTTIDLEPVDRSLAPAGHFISYHVYPHYPSLLNEDPVYRLHTDSEGRPDSYRGVLQALRTHHANTAFLVSEFGVPSSWGRARTSFSGMHQGGIDEVDQGEAAIRMFRDIQELGGAGGVWFQWEDGWWKTSWVSRVRAFPLDRNALWHDLLNPEQGYGLMAFVPQVGAIDTIFDGDGRIRRVNAAVSVEALELDIELSAPLADGELIELGLDVLDRERGEYALPSGTAVDVGLEAALVIAADANGDLSVSRCLDLHDHAATESRAPLRTGAPGCEGWVHATWVVGWAHATPQGCVYPTVTYDIGALHGRLASEPSSSLDAIVIDGARLRIRLPWSLVHFTDPSTRSVLEDDPDTSGLDAVVTDGIVLTVHIAADTIQTEPFTWPTWDVAPPVTERLKDGVEALFDYTRAMPRFVD